MSGLFRTTIVKGNRLTDFADTTATVGIPIPFGYGTYVTPGNVIWAPLPPVEHVARRRQGKGGVKQETYTYTLSYAIAFSQTIAGYRWIKRNGKVVYTTDPNAPIEDQEYAAKWATRAQFYYGTRTQLPDSTIESYEGSGQVSAFRGLAYVVVEDDDVTEGGGAVPTYEAAVMVDGLSYNTSPPYPVLGVEHVGTASYGYAASIVDQPIENMTTNAIALDGELRDVVARFSAWEGATTQAVALDGELRDVMIRSAFMEATTTSAFAIDGTLHDTKINYSATPENITTTATALDGSIT